MGSVNTFYKWLARSNTRVGTNNAQQTIMALKIFNRQLEGQYKRMEIQGNQAYQKAQARYEGGDKRQAYKLMRSALLYQKWTKKLDDFRMNLDDVQFQLSTARDMQNFDEVGNEMLRNLCELRLTLGNPQIQKMLNELNVGYGSLLSVYDDYIKKNELQEKMVPIEIRERDVRKEFGEKVKKEEPEDSSFALPDALGVSADEEDEDADDANNSESSDLFDLEKELARLRKKRNG